MGKLTPGKYRQHKPISLNRKLKRIVRSLNEHKRDRLQERADMALLIALHERDGRIVVCETGTDCDGYKYGPYYRFLPATYTHFAEHHADVHNNAEGPCYCYVVRPDIGDDGGVYVSDYYFTKDDEREAA